MSRSRAKRRVMNQINVVPYIDVMLVLLVIFMVTAPMTNPGMVELPKVGQTLKQTSAPLVITIKADKTTQIEGKVLQRDQLLAEVRDSIKQHPEQSVVIAADKDVIYDEVMSVMDLLKQNHVDKVGLLLKPASG